MTIKKAVFKNKELKRVEGREITHLRPTYINSEKGENHLKFLNKIERGN
jgi:hypothetical protein